MTPEEKQQFEALKQEAANLKRELDTFKNPATISELFLSALVKKGFLRSNLDITYLSNSNLEFTTVFADFKDRTVALTGFDKSYYIKFTADTSDVCTSNAHGLNDGDPVYLISTGNLPTPLVTTTLYYIRDATTNTFKLTATLGGAAVNITNVGTGAHYLQIQ